MTCYYVQHRGNEINKIICLTGLHADIMPVPETKSDKVEIISKDEYELLTACNGNMDTLFKLAESILNKVNK